MHIIDSSLMNTLKGIYDVSVYQRWMGFLENDHDFGLSSTKTSTLTISSMKMIMLMSYEHVLVGLFLCNLFISITIFFLLCPRWLATIFDYLCNEIFRRNKRYGMELLVW